MSELVEVIFRPGTATEFVPRWSRVLVRKSLDELANYFEVDMDFRDRSQIAQHDRFVVLYSRGPLQHRLVATGFVDNISARASSREVICQINGRSRARDIIDSEWSGTYSNITLFKLVHAFGTQFDFRDSRGDVDVWAIGSKVPDPTKLITDFSFEAQSPWPLLQQEAANQGFMITSSQSGGLYVWPVASGNNLWGFELVEGLNIKTINDSMTGSEQYFHYIIKGGGEEVEGFDWTCPNRKRVLTLNLTDENLTKDKLKQRVATEIRRRRNRHITVGVDSWGLGDDKVIKNQTRPAFEAFWEINFMTPVTIPSLGIKDTLLTSQVELEAMPTSTRCDIQLSRREEYLREGAA